MSALGPEALDLVRRRVINVVGHELRTPLTTIRGLAELLSEASEEELRAELIPALLRNARRAERLLDDLLIAGEVTTAQPAGPATTVDLGPLVAAAAAGTGVVVRGEPVGPVVAHADAVADALDRLIDNAVRYSDDVASVGFDHDEDTVTVVVTTPVGHDVPDLELGFELFFRGEQAVMRSSGLGVGLPVARGLARMDGGDVTIDQDGETVVSRLRLPRAP